MMSSLPTKTILKPPMSIRIKTRRRLDQELVFLRYHTRCTFKMTRTRSFRDYIKETMFLRMALGINKEVDHPDLGYMLLLDKPIIQYHLYL